MGFLKKLFGPPKPPSRPYVDQGLALTKRLIGLLNLSDWATGVPDYTEQEARAIDRELRSFQSIADQSAQRDGSQDMRFHPEFIPPMQRRLGADALRRLAGPELDVGWELDDDYCPIDWKSRVSTYLKAWAMNLDPSVLMEMAQLLALAGYQSEARQAAGIVAACFPSYAPRFFAGAQSPELVAGITEQARGIMTDISNMDKRPVAQHQLDHPTSISDPQPGGSLPAAQRRDLTHEELMELVKQSSTRELTDEEMTILTDRLSWRDEATKAQWYREQEDRPTEAPATSKIGQQKLPE